MDIRSRYAAIMALETPSQDELAEAAGLYEWIVLEDQRDQIRDVSIPAAPNGSVRAALEALLAQVEARLAQAHPVASPEGE